MTSLEKQHGDVFERYIREECRDLREAGLALVRQNWMAPEVPESGVHARILPSKPDFSGVLEGGRATVFEAKATMKPSWPLSDLAGHQADHLADAHELGAFAWVYILDGKRRKWVVPWPFLASLDRESYPFGHWPEHRKQDGETWLDTAHRLELLE